MTHFTAKIIPSPPTTQLIFDTRPSSHKTPVSTPAGTDAENSGLDSGAESERPPTPPTPLEEKEEVDLVGCRSRYGRRGRLRGSGDCGGRTHSGCGCG